MNDRRTPQEFYVPYSPSGIYLQTRVIVPPTYITLRFTPYLWAIYSSVYIQGGVNYCTFVHKMINQDGALLSRAVAAGGAEGARASPSNLFARLRFFSFSIT